MQALLKLARPAALAAIVAMAGCIKQDQTFTVYPDGSGKIQLSATVLPMVAQMMKAGEAQGRKGSGGDEMFKGLKQAFTNVYWANLQKSDGEDGSLTLSGTAYFEDINQVRAGGGGGMGGPPSEPKQLMTFRKDDGGDGHVLEVNGELLGGGNQLDNVPEEQVAQAKMMLQGFESKVTVVMPGAVKSADPLKTSGREAVSHLTDKDIMDIIDKKTTRPEKVIVVSGAPDDAALAGEIETFKKELAEAKAAAEKDAGSAKKPEPKKGEKKDGEKKGGGEKKGQDF